eukprot:15478886-Alexandrium_andersonii.AAC.1
MRAEGIGAGSGLAPAGHGAGIGRLLPPVRRPDLPAVPAAPVGPAAVSASSGSRGEPLVGPRPEDPSRAAGVLGAAGPEQPGVGRRS